MNLLEIGKSLLCVIGAIICLLFFKDSLFSKEQETQMIKEKYSKETIKAFKWTDKMRDLLAHLCALFLFIIGLIFIYNEFARYYDWELIFVNN